MSVSVTHSANSSALIERQQRWFKVAELSVRLLTHCQSAPSGSACEPSQGSQVPPGVQSHLGTAQPACAPNQRTRTHQGLRDCVDQTRRINSRRLALCRFTPSPLPKEEPEQLTAIPV